MPGARSPLASVLAGEGEGCGSGYRPSSWCVGVLVRGQAFVWVGGCWRPLRADTSAITTGVTGFTNLGAPSHHPHSLGGSVPGARSPLASVLAGEDEGCGSGYR